jgi:hypothetical protein
MPEPSSAGAESPSETDFRAEEPLNEDLHKDR